MNKIEEILKSTNNIHFPLSYDIDDDASTRWQKKQVDQKYTINLLNEKIIKDFQANTVYTALDKGVRLKGSTHVEVMSPRPTLSATWSYNELDLSSCNRLRFVMNISATGYHNFYIHLNVMSKGVWHKMAPSIKPNEDVNVLWEIDSNDIKSVQKIMVNIFMMGCPPEAKENVTIDIKDIVAEKVDAEYDYGWEVKKGISYHHLGYHTEMEKRAFVGKTNETMFYLEDSLSKKVYSDKIKHLSTTIGKFNVLDFTNFKEKGQYRIVVGQDKSNYFEIGDIIYDTAIIKSINFLKSLRCGEDVVGIHSACHLNCRTFNDKGDSVPNFGGWHDAGDVSQFEICTAEMAYALIELATSLKELSEALYIRVLEEAKIGIDWLLRTRFGNGERALAVTYYVWRQNVLKADDKTAYLNNAENGPFENFLAAAAIAAAALAFRKIDPIYSDWALNAAIEDYNFACDGYKKGLHTLRWGKNIDQQTSGAMITAAVELYKVTQNSKFISDAAKAAKMVINCQEKDEIGEMKLRGFFYEDPKHEYILSYEHRGHEETAIKGLVLLLENAPNHENKDEWLNCLKLYREYVTKTLMYTSPYNLLIGGIYDVNKLNIEHFTFPKNKDQEALETLRQQIIKGEKITESAYIRRMPIAYSRKGFHATLLSKTKAVSMMARYFNDSELIKITNEQLEWIIGRNPFNTSTMYGEGHNYHPLYVAFSPQIVGALPVGIKTKDDNDIPYWPTAVDAVYKEIWGHTTGKYLSVIADIYKYNNKNK